MYEISLTVQTPKGTPLALHNAAPSSVIFILSTSRTTSFVSVFQPFTVSIISCVTAVDIQ